ncbi:MAG: hypothetical protein U0641_05620 [Anaerolineae bacterium]
MAKKPVLNETTTDAANTDFNIRFLNPQWPVAFKDGDYPKTLKLAQNMTPEVVDGAAEAGEYLIANTILPGFKELLVIPVAYAHTWTMLDTDGETVLKKSVDDRFLYYPDGCFIEANEGWKTRDEQWNDDDTKWLNGKKPKCQPGHTFLFYLPLLNTYATFTFQSTSYQIGKQVLDAFNLFGPGRAVLVLGSKQTTSKRYSYFVATARFERNVSDEVKEARERLADTLSHPALPAAA